MAIRYLPPEIVTDIFVRLPFETLSNVILVDKFCLQFISSPAFARAHLKQGKTNLSTYRFILPSGPYGRSVMNWYLNQLSFASLMFESRRFELVNLDYPERRFHGPHIRVVGSCDGLVCIVLRNTRVVLWNPFTRKYKILPRFDDNKEISLGLSYGFGYDESTDDYKVVRISSFGGGGVKRNKKMCRHVVHVFSSKKESWKGILRYWKGHNPHLEMGKLISGKLHWLSGLGNDYEDLKIKIVSFDVGSEVLGIVELPNYDEDGVFDMKLDVLDGCMCLLITHIDPGSVDLWVLKEYGVKESWTKVVTISCDSMIYKFSLDGTVLPNGEILFHSQSCLAVYNLKNGSFRFLHERELWDHCFQPVVYFQSLVSPLV